MQKLEADTDTLKSEKGPTLDDIKAALMAQHERLRIIRKRTYLRHREEILEQKSKKRYTDMLKKQGIPESEWKIPERRKYVADPSSKLPELPPLLPKSLAEGSFNMSELKEVLMLTKFKRTMSEVKPKAKPEPEPEAEAHSAQP